MKNLRILAFLVVLGLGNATVKAQNWKVINSNDKSCVIKGKDNGTFGKMKSVIIMVDNQRQYRYEFNWKTQTGKRGEKCSWIGDVMEIAMNACKKGISLESLGFEPIN
jgi:predicted 3-demethylubiquinone-9 3-methyltransferase (glyoxalase superfamily)